MGAATTVAPGCRQRRRLPVSNGSAASAAADIALAIAARPRNAPPGSKGLGLYLVPRLRPDGTPNRYRIRRLKEKLGTRGLPTGEIEFFGAEAQEVAPPPQGFKLMMDALEFSRVHNAMAAAGVQRAPSARRLSMRVIAGRSAPRSAHS
jgi:alkylation response protein AidB-like acyl-CoA dehydrogenase